MSKESNQRPIARRSKVLLPILYKVLINGAHCVCRSRTSKHQLSPFPSSKSPLFHSVINLITRLSSKCFPVALPLIDGASFLFKTVRPSVPIGESVQDRETPTFHLSSPEETNTLKITLEREQERERLHSVLVTDCSSDLI